jgi:hypothetical protein
MYVPPYARLLAFAQRDRDGVLLPIELVKMLLSVAL